MRLHRALVVKAIRMCCWNLHVRPPTVDEMSKCLTDARQDPAVGVVVLTGAGDLAFCSGGDQSVRGQVCVCVCVC